MRLWTYRSKLNRSKHSRWLAAALVLSAVGAAGQDLAAEAWRLESGGDAEQAVRHLRQAATTAPNDPGSLRAYAEFLERHPDPATREAYARLNQSPLGAAAGPQRGALSGEYVGASGQVAVGVGVGGNVLVGGSNRSVTLQPFSVEGDTGINLAVGVSGMVLRPAQ